ncbi:MAG: pyrroline-5-carboxylate reductase [Bacteroidaceae bacterium]|nr:pyrroline-5-carboxylate reductase [Bacteroidaceae bacterium]
MNITIIGAGNMGGALAKGWTAAGENVTVTARTQQTLDRIQAQCPQLHTSLNNIEAIRSADVIVLGVKPWLIEGVCAEIREHIDIDRQLLCSLAAGVTTQQLRDWTYSNGPAAFAVMPNIAAEFRQSMTFVAPAPKTPQHAIDTIERLYRLVGDVYVCEEHLMDPGMVMAGCGIAYVMRYLRAQTEAGVEMGFRPHDALNIALQTMQGTVTLLRETGLHPEDAIDRVTTAGGRAIRGLNAMDHTGFNSAVIRSMKAGLEL